MKRTRSFLFLLLMSVAANAQNTPVNTIDLTRYSGKWYSLASIPTFLDKNWRETIENYTLNKDGYYDVLTTYRKVGDEKVRDIKSKLFPGDESQKGEMAAQFIWPFKAGYRVIELADDYSYTIVGHPTQKFLFIMSREPLMNKGLYEAIVQRCKSNGYDVNKLVSQEHRPGIR